MLFQLHWQHPTDFTKTEFVAQDSASTQEECAALLDRFEVIMVRRRDEVPEGWIPLVCDETSDRFVWAANEVKA